jgi:hydroxymethylglutaryl-CoA lyase
MKVYN